MKSFTLRKYGSTATVTVSVEFVRTEHWSSDPKMTAYEVVVGGETVGKIERATESTDRHYGRIRVPGKGRLAWGWSRADIPFNKEGHSHRPGVYESNRANAVARVLGYDYGMSS